jgi:hypothetical protein
MSVFSFVFSWGFGVNGTPPSESEDPASDVGRTVFAMVFFRMGFLRKGFSPFVTAHTPYV